ncbi:predicted protein [Uncinocarpus reesii 1704]|uniref:Uncharacterized protein n=1 Tax=Uncinocarpus reesii (strain UAMH 1704) TaxID=336963 RepID=C4JP91_UNCRE|nr:uncharacterized protein UREG_04473 [Uncinocarpus reesii 1704]EEP79627.1 predicted protein [Uncinocarpus reesii 1704]
MPRLTRQSTYLSYHGATTPGAGPNPSIDSNYAARNWNFNFSLPEIQKILRKHKVFTVAEGYEMHNLPKFHDLTAYGISEDDELKLWEEEVRRLLDAADMDNPLTLNNGAYRNIDALLGSVDQDGYSKLDRLSMQIVQALSVCVHDSQLLLIEFCPELANFKFFEIGEQKLRNEFDVHERKERYHSSLRLEEGNEECYHALVDYITAVLIRVLLRSAEGPYWQHNCIASVAKHAAKLKVIAFDLAGAISTSLQAASEVRHRMLRQKDSPSMVMPDGDDKESPFERRRKALQGDRSNASLKYFHQIHVFEQSIFALLDAISVNLGSAKRSGLPVDVFEASALIYETYVNGRLTLLCGGRDGSIGITSNPLEIRCATTIFEVCRETLRPLQRSQQTAAADTQFTEIQWKWTDLGQDGNLKGSDSGKILFYNMDSLITALVPFLMMDGKIAFLLNTFLTGASFYTDPTEPVRPFAEIRFIAAFSIRTSAYREKRSGLISETGVCSVPNTPMWARVVATSHCYSPEDKLRRDREKAMERVKEGMDAMSQWTMDEKSIIVPSAWYSWSVLSVCGVLVAGGLAIGLSVETRIRGVDPFNIAIFCWALAGFVMVVAKSVRVENWPWRDFLLGQVVCRSITELHAVTGADAQLILALLLRFESRIQLHTRGPFHTVFSRKADDGFSIDEPMKTSTLIDGGLVFVRVQSLAGPALVSISAGYLGCYNEVAHQGSTEEGSKPICRDLNEVGRWERGSDGLPLLIIFFMFLATTISMASHFFVRVLIVFMASKPTETAKKMLSDPVTTVEDIDYDDLAWDVSDLLFEAWKTSKLLDKTRL